MGLKINTCVPILTTITRGNHNLGDTFIGLGMQYLFERVVDHPKWLIVSKFDGTDGVRQFEEYIREAGFMIFAGMPQYHDFNVRTDWHDDKLWEEVVQPWNVKMFTMAGGSGGLGPDVTPKEFTRHCLTVYNGINIAPRLLQYRKDHSVAITTRDLPAHKLLQSAMVSNELLPCSATFATHKYGIKPAPNRNYVGLVLPQFPMVRLDDIPDQYKQTNGDPTEIKKKFVLEQFADIYNTLIKSGQHPKIICHERSEFDAVKSIIDVKDVFFSTDYFATLKFYSYCHSVISARLHGCLPAYGIPGTKVVGISVDVRGQAVRLFPKIRDFSMGKFTTEEVIDALKAAQPSTSEDLAPWLQKYDNIILKGFKNLGY